MKMGLDGHALVYCEGAFNTSNGKTAHGLVRFTRRYEILGVVDSKHANQDSGVVLDGIEKGIPIFRSIENAVHLLRPKTLTHLIMGIAPDGGRLGLMERKDIMKAISLGLNIDSGLHDFISEDSELVNLAQLYGVRIRDIRKPPNRNSLHFFSGKIEDVKALKTAILGTDSAVGKRTTAWLLHFAFNRMGLSSVFIGTGQTAWLQGAEYCIILDSLVNDFVSGEIEHVIWQAWKDNRPDVIIIEGQGSLLNPAYPGGFELLAAGRPDIIVLQHVPMRKEYDGFPGYALHPLKKQIKALEIISNKPIAAITINHEGLETGAIEETCTDIGAKTGLFTEDVLRNGADNLAAYLWHKYASGT